MRVLSGAYPGVPASAAAARRDAMSALAGCQAAADVVWCLNEITINAIVHSRSGPPGGSFTVSIRTTPGAWVTVTVSDQGGPAPDDYAHGLVAVASMATWLAMDAPTRNAPSASPLPGTAGRLALCRDWPRHARPRLPSSWPGRQRALPLHGTEEHADSGQHPDSVRVVTAGYPGRPASAAEARRDAMSAPGA